MIFRTRSKELTDDQLYDGVEKGTLGKYAKKGYTVSLSRFLEKETPGKAQILHMATNYDCLKDCAALLPKGEKFTATNLLTCQNKMGANFFDVAVSLGRLKHVAKLLPPDGRLTADQAFASQYSTDRNLVDTMAESSRPNDILPLFIEKDRPRVLQHLIKKMDKEKLYDMDALDYLAQTKMPIPVLAQYEKNFPKEWNDTENKKAIMTLLKSARQSAGASLAPSFPGNKDR